MCIHVVHGDGGGRGWGDPPTNMWGRRATFISRNSYFEVKNTTFEVKNSYFGDQKTAILK